MIEHVIGSISTVGYHILAFWCLPVSIIFTAQLYQTWRDGGAFSAEKIGTTLFIGGVALTWTGDFINSLGWGLTATARWFTWTAIESAMYGYAFHNIISKAMIALGAILHVDAVLVRRGGSPRWHWAAFITFIAWAAGSVSLIRMTS